LLRHRLQYLSIWRIELQNGLCRFARGEALGAPGDALSFPFEMDVLPATDTAFGLTFVVEIA
jgi:hypothetical protein